jgi:hypothetical protein
LNAFDDLLGSLGGLGGRSSRLSDVLDGIFSDKKTDLKTQIIWWLLRHGTHEPKCGYAQKGDLVRWKDCAVGGGKTIRMPTVRVDYLQMIVSGKIDVKGTELVAWISTKLNDDARGYFIALKRSQER